MISIPRSTDYTLKEGDTGIVVFALQRVANRLGITCDEDMAFGPKTKAVAKTLQRRLNVVDDGIFGPASQAALATYLCRSYEREHDLPEGLLASVVAYESGGYLGAVNWQVDGGVDCGITQRRVYAEDYDDDAVLKRAFDAQYQVNLSGGSFSELYEIFLARAGTKRNSELAWRLAVLNHNYPTLADRISRYGYSGLTAYYVSPQDWVETFAIKFPDGTRVRTPLEWGQRYALGNAAHNEPGQAVKGAKL